MSVPRPISSPRRRGLAAAAGLALLLAAGDAGATVVSGQVTGPGGTPLADVDLDFIDRATGDIVPTTNDDTDAFGFYAVDVPPADYDVQFEPVAGARWTALEVQQVVGLDPVTLDVTLDPGFLVSARILGPDLTPFDGALLEVVDATTGVELWSHLDRAGVDGVVQPIVPAGTWDLTFRAPLGAGLIPVEMPGQVVDADRDYGDIVLERGYQLSGVVVGPSGEAVGGATVAFHDASTDALVDAFTTGPTGAYDAFMEGGAYVLRVTPAPGSRYFARSFHGLVVVADAAVPALVLDRAVTVAGSVTDEFGAPIFDVDTDWDDAFTGERASTPSDDTDVDGRYEVVLRPSSYDIGFDPPRGSRFIAQELKDVPLFVDVIRPTVVLESGFFLSGTVLGPGGAPAVDADVDVIDATTGEEVPLAVDSVAADGTFSVPVPAGTFDLVVTPPRGSGWGRAERAGVVVAADLDIGTITLPAAVPAAPTDIAPAAGPSSGGDLVTITGADLQPGARVTFGGFRGIGVSATDGTTLTVTTPAHPVGVVDVVVENPGAPPVVLPESYAFEPSDGPVLRVRRGGFLDNDIFLEWDATGAAAYAVFRADVPHHDAGDLVTRLGGTLLREDGGVVTTPPLTFWVVH